MDVGLFQSIIGQTSFAPQSHFEVQVFGPISGIGITDVAAEIPFRCSNVSIPGRQVLSTDHITYGPHQKIATGASYEDVALEIILSEDFAEKLFFERWQDFAVGFARGMQGVEAGMFDVGYYAEYIGTVVIRQFSTSGDIIYEAVLFEAYPTTIQALTSSWDTHEPHKLSVQMAYRYFTDDPDWKSSVDSAFAEQAAQIAAASALGLIGAGGAGTGDIGFDPGAGVGSGSDFAPGELEQIIITPTSGTGIEV